MNAFEQVAELLLRRHGYWTMSSYKVYLSKEAKKRIGRDSSPRWEIDIVAYNVKCAELLIVECKSYIDSKGVQFADLKSGAAGNGKYKLFTEPTLRDEVFKQAKDQLLDLGLVAKECSVKLCLVAGLIRLGDQDDIEKLFDANSWRLFGPNWLREQLTMLSQDSFSDDIASITSKLLLRNRVTSDLSGLVLEIRDLPSNPNTLIDQHRAGPLICYVLSMKEMNEDGSYRYAEVMAIERSGNDRYKHVDDSSFQIPVEDVVFNIVAIVHDGVKHKHKDQKRHFKKYPKWKIITHAK